MLSKEEFRDYIVRMGYEVSDEELDVKYKMYLDFQRLQADLSKFLGELWISLESAFMKIAEVIKNSQIAPENKEYGNIKKNELYKTELFRGNKNVHYNGGKRVLLQNYNRRKVISRIRYSNGKRLKL